MAIGECFKTNFVPEWISPILFSPLQSSERVGREGMWSRRYHGHLEKQQQCNLLRGHG